MQDVYNTGAECCTHDIANLRNPFVHSLIITDQLS